MKGRSVGNGDVTPAPIRHFWSFGLDEGPFRWERRLDGIRSGARTLRSLDEGPFRWERRQGVHFSGRDLGRSRRPRTLRVTRSELSGVVTRELGDNVRTSGNLTRTLGGF